MSFLVAALVLALGTNIKSFHLSNGTKLNVRETVPLLISDMGNKTVSVLAHKLAVR